MDKLHPGVQLEIHEAQKLAMGSQTVVIALAGMKECGKTSLLARLHQQFQAGSLGGYDFAGSRTLLRFEEMNWLAMLESGESFPKMIRSSRQFDNSFLHFRVRKTGSTDPAIEVLLNDVSGETFPDAIAAESICEQLLCLRRADHLVLVVDGESLASRALRHDHCAKIHNFAQRVLQTGQVGKRTALHLLVSKEDSLKSQGNPQENQDAVKKLAADFSRLFAQRVAQIHVWLLAARPQDGSLPTIEPIDKLFGTLVGTTHRMPEISFNGYAVKHPSRDFCGFGNQQSD